MSAGYQNGQTVRAPGDFGVAGSLNVRGGLAVPGITGSEDGLTTHALGGAGDAVRGQSKPSGKAGIQSLTTAGTNGTIELAIAAMRRLSMTPAELPEPGATVACQEAENEPDNAREHHC